MKRKFFKPLFCKACLIVITLTLTACGGGGGGSENANPVVITPTVSGSQYVVFAWNDLGMHCLSPSYDTCVILPPYNTVWAQVIKRGNPPQVVTADLTVEYRIINNTTSQKGFFSQFWTYAQKLFNSSPLVDKGLNLVDSTISNSLSGTMVAKGDHFQVNGIPVVPIEDNGVKNPYQVAEITVKDASGAVVAQTRATVPTSDEINCGKCHAAGGTVTQVFKDVLAKHDKYQPTLVLSNVNIHPVLCASCHGSPALGTTGAGSSGKYLSQAIHGFHANLIGSQQPACYDCHPGASTKCNRSTKHTNNNAADGNCMACHGSLANVAATIASIPARIPWENEPKCSATSCHSITIPQVDTGTTLYRNAAGHGGVYCAGCHGSPHAMVPSRQASDNYQALQYQNSAKSIGSCGACHPGSKGEGLGGFLEKHGSGGIDMSCKICHTAVTTIDTTKWPHQYQWKNR